MVASYENKVKFFASYLGADVEITDPDGTIQILPLSTLQLVAIESIPIKDNTTKTRLILKSIKDIEPKHEKYLDGILKQSFRNMIGDFKFCIYRHALPQSIDIIRYLRFHGYCVEWNREEYEKIGWIKPLEDGK